MLINQAQAPMTQSATFTPSHSPPRLCVCSHQNYLQGKGGQSSCVEKKKNLKHTCLWTESKTLCWYVQPLIISYRIDKKKLIPAHAKS